jgi:hypothetical protein
VAAPIVLIVLRFMQGLAIGGQFVAAIDNPRDKWLHELLRNLFPKVHPWTKK